MSGSLAGGSQSHFCPRLLDYIVIVGARNPNGNSAAQTPELLRRYPVEDHDDFPLPPDVVFFCQPEGCISAGVKRVSLREDNSFVFSLTEKDSNRVRFGICMNFYRPFEKRNSTDHGRNLSGEQQTLQKPRTESIDGDDEGEPQTHRRRRKQGRVRNNTLTSLCIVSHHPFFSTFRECLFILKRLIDACNQRTGGKKVGAAKGTFRNSVWGVLTGNRTDDKASLVTHDVRELETWICRLLSAPVCIPGKTRVEVSILPTEMQAPMAFALPDAHRFCLADFPMHLPLELLGVETCLKVLTCILLEHKIVLQSRDYNALSMSVMAFVAMIYPMEYMFPVIPLLPTCMSCAEQVQNLLLVPSPYIIGVPASFFLYKADFKLPDDVWLIDLDSNKITVPRCADELPPLPEPEGTQLKNHLKQALSSMSMAPQPILNLDKVQEETLAVPVRNASPSTPEMGFNPLIYGNDVDSVDIATRVAMVKFFTSKNVLGDHWVHTRTLRLYPRPVVAFQLATFLKSRGKQTDFIKRLASTQAVEYFGEWCLAPTNTTFQRIQNTVHDPVLIGDKPKWYAHQLAPVQFNVYDDNSTLASALELAMTDQVDSQSEPPTDESGSDTGSDVSEDAGGSTTSSSYSSLSDFVTDMINSGISGTTPSVPEIEVDREALAHCSPPSTLQVPPMLQESPSPATMSPHSTATTPSPDSEKQAINPMFHEEGDRGNDTDADIDSLNYDSDSSHPSKTDALEYIAKQAKGRAELETDNNNIPKSRPYGPSMSMYELPVHGGEGAGRGAGLPSLVEKGDPQSAWSLASIANKISNLKIDQSDAESVSSATSSDRNGYTRMKSSMSSFFSFATDSLQRSSSGVSTLSTRSRGSDGGKSFGPFPRAPSSRKALADKSLIRHSSSQSSLRRPPPPNKGSPQSPTDSSKINSSENQQFLKDMVSGVLEGQGVGWLQLKKLKRLMEQESLRMFVINRLLENAVRDEENSKEGRYSDHIEDVKVSRAVYKGMLAVLKACVVGLEHSHENHVPGGVSSAFGVLEIAHTHYYTKEVPQLPKRKEDFDKDEDKGSRRRKNYDTRSLDEENMVAALGKRMFLKKAWHLWTGNSSLESPTFIPLPSISLPTLDHWLPESVMRGSAWIPQKAASAVSSLLKGVPKGKNKSDVETTIYWGASSRAQRDPIWTATYRYKPGSDGFEVVEKPDGSTSGEDKESDRESIIEGAEGIDEDIKSAEDLLYIKQRRKMNKNNSVDSDTVSESSTLVSNSSETLANDSDYSTASNENLWPQRINHHSIRAAVSDSEIERTGGQMSPGRRAPTTTWHSKSTLSKGFRYRNGHLISTAGSTQDGVERHYIFEGLIGKERSALWENMQFWEDGYLDLVAQERELVGMDQGPADMIDRYKAMSAEDRKRLEEDEDKLLSTQLFNLVAYMVSMQVSKNECRRKIRRLLGKSHIGLLYSQDVMDVLDQINNLHGNDIDLKPYSSRYMRKQTFVVHAGTDTRGDLLFMEVCDDAIVLRTGNGQIQERWWYEKLINMTYCPKTKVLCLWRKKDNQTQLNKFYTKKCKELYFCVKDSMEKAAAKQNGKKPGYSLLARLIGELPMEDVHTRRKDGPELGGEFPIQDMQTGEGGLLQVTLEGINLKFIHTQAFIELKDIRKCNTEKGVFVLEQFDSQTRQVTVRKYKSSMANEICYAVLCVFSYVAAAKSQEKRELEAKSPVK
ncbi:MAP kinase-activating death domain protein-like isoform X3 [Branchiostoma lanceolatum]|uniref:MAP kinase-activating death domain protein-like isoform X3 n=1 Tax=Branchiostoma lanceolatum TaxID=7740 RepID=UPI0034535EB5